MKTNIIKYFVILTVLVLLSSCGLFKDNSSSNQNINFQGSGKGTVYKAENYAVSATDLKKLVKDGIEKRLNKNIDSKYINLDYPYYNSNSIFSTFYITDKNNAIGVIYADWKEDQYVLQFIDLYPIDESKPFSVINLSSKMSDGKRNFKAFFGFINDKSISEVRLNYQEDFNDFTNSVRLKSDNKTFLDVVIGGEMKIRNIEGRDSKDQVIFKYDY
ncbi:hypothetical protein SAMN04487895_1353 [Paenibacillus sophorae]|uniref:Lipoprotein n=1 Tax=Paenibacillus sophorae TaxID=1333845 RepID=A0A1H8W588_9BACL|nr:hypothetical protein [Paenibacillus sophorae]QWU16734.1 hypothetical protein KP014_05830 [Paenibacillus sophorae]SEP22703.1 hypothetical protein SAMN04487895_1353 [Paenibacillus sophorae]